MLRRAWSAAIAIALCAVGLSTAPAAAAAVPRSANIAVGGSHGCALMTTGRVECWGSNGRGELGNGTADPNSATPVLVRNVTHAVAVTSGANHSCALFNTGRIKCWGANSAGQLGDGTVMDRHLPVFVRGILHATKIAAGSVHTCAILSTGGAKCWGANFRGELGDGTTTERHVPVQVIGLLHGVTWISGGAELSCAVQRRVAKCWGYNSFGQLGDGTTMERHRPRTVLGLGTKTVVVNAGTNASCAFESAPGRNGNALFCWGYNFYGQVGDGTTMDRHRATPVLGMQTGVTSVSMGGDSSVCAVRLGAAKCWGFNEYGQLGDGTQTERHRPRQVWELARGVARVSAGLFSSCARLETGRVKCWGYGSNGELGNGSNSNRLVPVFVHLV